MPSKCFSENDVFPLGAGGCAQAVFPPDGTGAHYLITTVLALSPVKSKNRARLAGLSPVVFQNFRRRVGRLGYAFIISPPLQERVARAGKGILDVVWHDPYGHAEPASVCRQILPGENSGTVYFAVRSKLYYRGVF